MEFKKDKIIGKKLGPILEIIIGTMITLNILVVMTPLGGILGRSETFAYRLCMNFGYTDPIIQLTGIIYLVSLVSAVFGVCAILSGIISLFVDQTRVIRILKIIVAGMQTVVAIMAIISFLTYFNSVQYALINHVHMVTIQIWSAFLQVRILIDWIVVLIYLAAIVGSIRLLIRKKGKNKVN